MKKNTKMIALLLSLTLAAGALTACGGSDEGSTKSGAVVNIPIGQDLDNMDASRAHETYGCQLAMETQDTLVRYDAEGKAQPAGAESWDVSEDGLVYTFHLRDNKYSDGSSVVAADYANGLLRSLDPEVASSSAAMFYAVKGAQDYNNGKISREEVGVKALDDKTLEITLNDSLPYFIQMINAAQMTPIPERLTQGADNTTYGSDETKMVFSGPFMIEKWERGSKIVTKKNPNYWDAENVHIDTVNYLLVQEESTRGQMFEQGELDVLNDVNAQYYEQLKADIDAGKFAPVEMPKPSNNYIIFNNTDSKGVFTNAKIRLAFSLAVDRETYITKVTQKDKPAYGFVPPVTNNGDGKFRDSAPEPLADSKLDPKALLEEGLKEIGMKAEDLTVTFLQGNSNAGTKVRSEYFQNQWQEKLGVKVEIETAADGAAFNNAIVNGNYQITINGWGADYNDPMTFMQLFTTGDSNNSAHYSNEQYDKLVKEAVSEKDMAVRAQKFAEAEKILVLDDAGVAPLAYGFGTNLINPAVKGLVFNAAGGPTFEVRFATVD